VSRDRAARVGTHRRARARLWCATTGEEAAEEVSVTCVMAAPRRRAVVYGLSADPPTDVGGHASVVRALRAWTSDGGGDDSRVDEVLVTPVYEHAYSSKRRTMATGTTSYEARLAMCGLAFEDAVVEDAKGRAEDAFAPASESSFSGEARVVVSRGEARAARGREAGAKPGTTSALMALLRKEQPDTDFIICLGEDAFDDLITGKWHRGEELLREHAFIVAPRHGYESRRERNFGQKGVIAKEIREVSWLESRATAPSGGGAPVSSTRVRRALARRRLNQTIEDLCREESLPSNALHPKVFAYIVKHQLYLDGDASDAVDEENDDDVDVSASESESATPASASPGKKQASAGYFGSLTRKFSSLSPDPSAYFSREKTFVDVKDKDNLLAESRPLRDREVLVHERINKTVSREEFAALKAMPYQLFDRTIRTVLQNNPPGKTWSASKEDKYAKEAIERIRVVSQWRKENDVDELMSCGILPHADDMYANWPAYMHGHDEYGHPIVSEHPTLVNTAGLKARMSVKDIMRHRIQFMEALEYMKSHAQRAHTVYKHVVIIDLGGINVSFATGEVKKFMTELVKLFAHRYTDSLHAMYFVNTPVVFRVMWSVLQPLLSKTTKSKIFMFGVGPNQSKKLAKQLAKHDIPASSTPRFAGGESEGVRVDAFVGDALALFERLGARW